MIDGSDVRLLGLLHRVVGVVFFDMYFRSYVLQKFLGNTELTFNPPPHSEAERGLKITKEAFPGIAYLTQVRYSRDPDR